MRPMVLHHLMIALFACLASISSLSIHQLRPTSPTSVFRKSPSVTSIGSQLLPSFSANSGSNHPIPSPSVSITSAYAKDSKSITTTTAAHLGTSTMAYKMCTLIFEIFAGLCLVSIGGYETMLAVLSEIKGEQYRFERLVHGLHDLIGVQAHKHNGIVSKLSSLIEEQQELLVFDSIASALSMFNAIVNQPPTIEKRDALRTELERRGFEEFLKRLDIKRHTLPDSLQKQMDIYLKQKKMDGDKIRALENNKRQSILQL